MKPEELFDPLGNSFEAENREIDASFSQLLTTLPFKPPVKGDPRLYMIRLQDDATSLISNCKAGYNRDKLVENCCSFMVALGVELGLVENVDEFTRLFVQEFTSDIAQKDAAIKLAIKRDTATNN